VEGNDSVVNSIKYYLEDKQKKWKVSIGFNNMEVRDEFVKGSLLEPVVRMLWGVWNESKWRIWKGAEGEGGHRREMF
jgi:hypothetical protein